MIGCKIKKNKYRVYEETTVYFSVCFCFVVGFMPKQAITPETR